MKINWRFFGPLLFLLGFGAFLLNGAADAASKTTDEGYSFDVSEAVAPVLSPALRDMVIGAPEPELAREVNPIRWLGDGVGEEGRNIGLDPLAAQGTNPGTTPSPLVTFEGLPSIAGVTPPDTNGDVGPNHYIQMTNFHFAIWDKGDPDNAVAPTMLAGPIALGTFFASLGGGCQTSFGDPIVMYDDMADRWVLTQFDLSGVLGMCIAVSTTPDPLGTYWMYNISTPDFPDYPKFGVWPDGYYMGTNTGFPNQYYVHAFDRVSMLAGLPATRQSVGGLANLMLAADVDGTTPPPANSPAIFYTFYHPSATGHPPGSERLAIYEYDVDWTTPANTTFTLEEELPIASFNYTICGFFAGGCIPQPGTGELLDDIAWWPMHRLQYRNFGGYAAMVGNFTVDADGANHAGIRWFEIRKTGSTYTLFQEGTFFPDTNSRWMGSIAMDQDGNMALGYSVSSTSVVPSIRYATRLVSDPLGTFSAEASMWAGGGVQTAIHRWGDYSSMMVDPVDGCTFWYTNEYHDVNDSGFGWNTRVGVFRLNECGSPDFTLSATPDEQTVCTPNSALYAVTVGQVQGFTDPVTLSASGNPAGTTTNFSTNPVTPPGSSNLTIGNMGAAAAGSYAIEVMGVAPTSTHTTTVTLNVNTAVPGAPVLTTPANGATGVSLAPTFMWNAATQGGTYDLQVATDAGFSNIVYSADDIDGTSHAAASPLSPLTQHFWRVRSANACGDGGYSAAFSFTTSDIPPILLVDDDDDSPDVQPTWTAALDALGLSYDVWVTGASDVEPTGADMAPYEVILWFSGDRFGTQNAGPAGPSAATEAALATWLDGGGCFFISSQDYVWDKGVTSFMTSRLGVSTVTNDNGDYTSVTGQNVFGGLGPYTLTFPYSDFTDPITVGNGGVQAMLGNNGKVAGVSKELGAYKTSFWAFGLETLPQAGREATLEAFVNWCGLAAEVPEIEVTPASLSSTQAANTIVDQTLTIANTGTGTLDWDIFEDNSPAAATLSTGAPVAGAALAGSGLTGGSVTPVSSVANPNLMITHSNSQTITAGNSVACSGDGGFTTTDNQYLRAFDLDAFGIPTAFTVTSVEFGVENATSPGAGQPITVNLYEWDGVSALTYANLSLVGTTSTTLADQALTLVNVPVSGTVAAGEWLVAEVANPDGTGVNGFFIGSNAAGQSGPSYLASTSCGLPNPTNVANIGFPNMMIVMNVYGDPAGDISCDAPEDIPWLSLDQSSGSTGAGSSTDVTVTYDSTGLSPGTYSAALCVTSNDSGEPEVVVPVELEVTTGYMIYLPIAVREP